MRRIIEILGSSLNLTLQEFRSHKLRTALSLSGVAFGIFCIIGVLTMVDSLQRAVQNDIKALGSNTVYIDKWEYGGGADYPWWKYVKRPVAKYEEMGLLRQKSPSAKHIAMNINTNSTVEINDNVVSGVNYYGITEDFVKIQPIEIEIGRYFMQSDFDLGTATIIIGNEIATNLFGKPEKAVGQTVALKSGKKAVVIGLIKKQGKSFLGGGWDYDQCIMMSYKYLATIIREQNGSPVIMVQADEAIPMAQLKDELQGAMRSIRKIKPTEEDNFALNDIDSFAEFMDNIFGYINKGGWAIALLSLIVGMFGVANIMFVTVRERTSQIGLKKAIGAKKGMILSEFLLESAFLCILGGIFGLIGVFILTLIAGAAAGFAIFISPSILFLAISICVIVGIMAGIIPAFIAARMDPVVAIRSK